MPSQSPLARCHWDDTRGDLNVTGETMPSITTAVPAATGHATTAPPSPRARRVRLALYWFVTAVLVFETVAGSLWDLQRIEYVRAVFAHLGYPLYLLTILGAWKLPGAIVILAPGLPRLKEWAYAGVFF